MVVLPGMVHVALFADRLIHDMYGFHINGFVVDLVMTPGGIASLGASAEHPAHGGLIVAALLAAQAGAYYWLVARRRGAPGRCRIRWRWRWLVAWPCSPAWASASPMPTVRRRQLPAHPVRQRTLSALSAADSSASWPSAWASKPKSRSRKACTSRRRALNYPLAPLRCRRPAPLNIVWLVAESLRFDMLDPKIMPQLWEFSNRRCAWRSTTAAAT
jgi:membrane-anchored protein YejM (alkaline phosphatase superfamily)